MDIVIVYLMYFGALLVPAAYLVVARGRGSARRPMIIGVVFEVLAGIAVWALVAYSHRAGYRDSYMGWAFMLPINALCFLYFVGVIIFYARHE